MNGSGAHLDRPSPQVLRLLPHVKPPPARVLVISGQGQEARALDARGYEVTVTPDLVPTDFGGGFDLVCEVGASGGWASPAYAAAAARALRPGGQLFGAFAADASALLHAVGGHFEVERCQPAGDQLEVVLRRR